MPRSSRRNRKAAKEAEKAKFDKELMSFSVRLVECNQHGIKDHWGRELMPKGKRSKDPYFILPKLPLICRRLIGDLLDSDFTLDVGDFDDFWMNLNDIHKERRLLADYMVLVSFIENSQCIFPGDSERKAVLIRTMGKLLAYVRWRITFQERSHSFYDDGPRFFSMATESDWMWDVLGQFSRSPFHFESVGSIPMNSANGEKFLMESKGIFDAVSPQFLKIVVNRLMVTYFHWVALNSSSLLYYVDRNVTQDYFDLYVDSKLDQNGLLEKLRVAVPRWSRENRAWLQHAIGSNGKSCEMTYVSMLMENMGMAKYKYLVFGKEKFCAHCHRSSYVGEDRLWTCKRCDQEGLRPRARYCNKECQRADWRKHERETHIPNRVTTSTAKTVCHI